MEHEGAKSMNEYLELKPEWLTQASAADTDAIAACVRYEPWEMPPDYRLVHTATIIVGNGESGDDKLWVLERPDGSRFVGACDERGPHVMPVWIEEGVSVPSLQAHLVRHEAALETLCRAMESLHQTAFFNIQGA
jgi:hypothetical protein